MIATGSRRRTSRRDRADRWSRLFRATSVAVVLVGVVASVPISRGWQHTVTRQRDERLDRTSPARTTTVRSALGQYENALQTTTTATATRPAAQDRPAGWPPGTAART